MSEENKKRDSENAIFGLQGAINEQTDKLGNHLIDIRHSIDGLSEVFMDLEAHFARIAASAKKINGNLFMMSKKAREGEALKTGDEGLKKEL